MSSCCPPDSSSYLASSYSPVGSEVNLDGVIQFYEVNAALASDHKAVIIGPDWYGWNSGHTRNIADMIANTGFHVVVPRVLTPFIEGDGDGVSPDFHGKNRDNELFPWLLTFKWNILEPKMSALVNYLKASGATKIGFVGFCWGGWLACQTAIAHPEITSIAIPHPSIHVEGGHGGSPGELVQKVKCPMLLMPCGNDDATYYEGGQVYGALKANNDGQGREFIHPYPDMVHGFVTRGDMTDPLVKRDKEDALERIVQFLRTHTV